MFKNRILQTKLTDLDANVCMENIQGPVYRGDVTFVATLRALLFGRIEQGNNIAGCYAKFRDVPSNDINFNAFVGSCIKDEPNSIFVIDVNTGSDTDNDKVFNFVKSKHPQCWSKLNNVEIFFMKSFRVCCLVNKSMKTVILFVDTINFSKWHYLQCAIPVFLPWYFDPKDGLSETEMHLINSLRDKTPDRYIEIINKKSEQYDFREHRIKRLLDDFSSSVLKRRLDKVEREIRNCESRISDYNDQINLFIRKRGEYQITYLGLQQKILENGADSELIDYFLRNQSVDLINVTDGEMSFVSRGYITYYDEEQARTVINNPLSYVYIRNGVERENLISEDDTKRLMTAIFIDQKLRVKVCAQYVINILEQRLIPIVNSGVLLNPKYNNFVPNPHIDKYGCMGAYISVINNLLLTCDYIGVIEQCNASCRSLNFSDSIVMLSFMSIIRNNSESQRCYIELPNGDVVNTRGAIEWLNNEVNV